MTPSTVLCAECDRPVADSIPLCETCCKDFVDELMTVPGIVADIAITAARLDRMSNGRNGGKSAEVPLPIRIDKTDHLPHRRPFDALVTALVTWGRLVEEHYKISIPLGAAGLRELVRANRIKPDERQPKAELARIPVYEIVADEDDGFRKRVHVGYRVVAHIPRRDPDALNTTPITAAELVAVWLACNPASIRLMPASHEMIKDIRTAIARARLAVDRLPDLRFLGPCPTITGEQDGEPKHCGAGLRAENGGMWVRCGRCRMQHEVKTIIAEAKRRTEDRLWTLGQIAKYLDALDIRVPSSTLYDLDYHPRKAVPKKGWLHTDSIGRQTITTSWIHRDDPPVFRVGDVIRYFERRLVKGSTA